MDFFEVVGFEEVVTGDLADVEGEFDFGGGGRGVWVGFGVGVPGAFDGCSEVAAVECAFVRLFFPVKTDVVDEVALMLDVLFSNGALEFLDLFMMMKMIEENFPMRCCEYFPKFIC